MLFCVRSTHLISIIFREHAVFSCPTEGCGDGEDGSNYYVSVHVAGASEASTVGKEWICFTCGAQLTEKLSCRQLEGM